MSLDNLWITGRQKKILGNIFSNIRKTTAKVGPTPPPEFVYHPEYQNFKKNCKEMWRKWREAQRISRILRELKRAENQNEEQKSMINMLGYLGLVESLGVTMMHIALLFLIANGRELHTKGHPTKHAKTFKELEGIWDNNYKLGFLKSSGVSIFGKKIVNTELRNIIAHLNFTVEKNSGEIRGGKRNKIIDIEGKISNFWKGIDIVNLVLEDIGFVAWLRQKVASHE